MLTQTIPARPLRIALAGFVHESNSFAPSPADMAAFDQGGGYLPLCRGAQIIDRARDVNLPIAGVIAHGEKQGWQMVPVVWAGAVPIMKEPGLTVPCCSAIAACR